MHTLKTKSRIDIDGHLRLDLPTDLPTGDVELVVVIQSASQQHGRQYAFDDLAGTLRWQGDATREQRSLRDEW